MSGGPTKKCENNPMHSKNIKAEQVLSQIVKNANKVS